MQLTPAEADFQLSAAEDDVDVTKVLAGDVAAFEGIVRRWQSPLINLAYRFCRDRDRAEDTAQQAFLRAYRSLGKWRRQAAFGTPIGRMMATLVLTLVLLRIVLQFSCGSL